MKGPKSQWPHAWPKACLTKLNSGQAVCDLGENGRYCVGCRVKGIGIRGSGFRV